MIAQIQVDAAKKLMSSQLAPVTGSVRSVHINLNMFVSFFFSSSSCVLMPSIGQTTPSLYRTGRPHRRVRLLWVREPSFVYGWLLIWVILFQGFSFAGGTTCVQLLVLFRERH
jgi:hypothetical protein